MAQFAGELPVESLRQALPYLRRPFTSTAVRFKIQSAWAEKVNPGALIVSYVDARLVVERLNAVVSDLWVDKYDEPLGNPNAKICRLTVAGVTREDVGEAGGIAREKALRSNALKRAAVKFGIGVSIYAVPKIILNKGNDLREIDVWDAKAKAKKKSFALSDRGEVTCRERYTGWLEEKGTPTFGEPLDHGDVAGSQGDWEVDAGSDTTDGEAASTSERFLAPEELAKLKATVEEKGRDLAVLMGAIGIEGEGLLTNIHAFEIWDLLGESPKPAARAPRRRKSS